MNVIEEHFCEQVKNLNENFQITEKQLSQLAAFYQNLCEWNKVMNLTTITEEKDVYEKHFLDSLSILKLFQPTELVGKNLIDVGTGAGFPGLVLAICFPELKVTLMDSLNKRINFLNDTVDKLQLQNVTTIHARAEELAKNKVHREHYDFAVSRAVANLATLSEYTLPFTKVHGSFIAYKSEKADEEIQSAGKALQILGGKIVKMEKFTLPGTDYERCLIQVEKVKNTPGKYPRKAGTPAKEPL